MRSPLSVTSSAAIVTTLPDAVAANFRAVFADQRERFVDDDRPGVNAGFDANRLVRRGRVDAFLKRRSSAFVKKSVIAKSGERTRSRAGIGVSPKRTFPDVAAR